VKGKKALHNERLVVLEIFFGLRLGDGAVLRTINRAPVRLVRRGAPVCWRESLSCGLTLFTVESVHSVD
jgi:hypothetical protein